MLSHGIDLQSHRADGFTLDRLECSDLGFKGCDVIPSGSITRRTLPRRWRALDRNAATSPCARYAVARETPASRARFATVNRPFDVLARDSSSRLWPGARPDLAGLGEVFIELTPARGRSALESLPVPR